MKKSVALLMVAFALVSSACVADTLPTTTPAPLTVQITGPDNLVQLAVGQSLGIPFAGCGYSIDWGDGATAPQAVTQGPPYCEADLTHIYAAPGDYTIAAKTWGQGPADEVVGEVELKAIITVK